MSCHTTIDGRTTAYKITLKEKFGQKEDLKIGDLFTIVETYNWFVCVEDGTLEGAIGLGNPIKRLFPDHTKEETLDDTEILIAKKVDIHVHY